jgi:hypothetical protein
VASPEEINADMLAFWNGKGGHIWVARQVSLLKIVLTAAGWVRARTSGRPQAARRS